MRLHRRAHRAGRGRIIRTLPGATKSCAGEPCATFRRLLRLRTTNAFESNTREDTHMCIICVSKSGIRQPGDALLRSMFLHNPHGAGFMYARDGRVMIHKGFMDMDEYIRAVHQRYGHIHHRLPLPNHPSPLRPARPERSGQHLPNGPVEVCDNGRQRLRSHGRRIHKRTRPAVQQHELPAACVALIIRQADRSNIRQHYRIEKAASGRFFLVMWS